MCVCVCVSKEIKQSKDRIGSSSSVSATQWQFVHCQWESSFLPLHCRQTKQKKTLEWWTTEDANDLDECRRRLRPKWWGHFGSGKNITKSPFLSWVLFARQKMRKGIKKKRIKRWNKSDSGKWRTKDGINIKIKIKTNEKRTESEQNNTPGKNKRGKKNIWKRRGTAYKMSNVYFRRW